MPYQNTPGRFGERRTKDLASTKNYNKIHQEKTP